MAESIDRLYRLTVDATQAVSQLQKMNQAAEASAAKMDKFAAGLKTAGGVLAGAFAVDVIVSNFHAVVDSMDELIKATQEVGVAASNLQTLRYAAQASGASAEELDKGLQKLAQNLQDVEAGTTDAAKALRALGVTGADSTTQAFAKIAEGFASLPDGAQKTALALDIFGKAGARLIPTLNNGREGLADLASEARELGLVMGEGALKAAEHFNDQLEMLANIGKATAQSFVTGLLPALQAIAAEMIDAKKGGDGLVEWGRLVGAVFLHVAEFATLVVGGFRKVAAAVGVLVADIAQGFEDRAVLAERWSEAQAEADDKTSESLLKLRERYDAASQAIKGFVGPIMPTSIALERMLANLHKTAEATDKLSASQQHAADMMKTYNAAAKANADEDERAAKAEEDRRKSAEALERELHPAEAALKDVRKAADEWQKAQEDEAARQQGLVDLLATGTEWQKKFAAAELAKTAAVQQGTETLSDQTDALSEHADVLQVIGQGFQDFFNQMIQNTANAASAFTRMVESMIVALLRLAAEKFILNELTGVAGVEAQGDAFLGGERLAFAAGGVVMRPTRFRMARGRVGLMGEAGPEAIMPLQRTSDGALGVRAQAVPLNVAIHNHTDAQVSARRDSNGDLQVVIEQTKRAVAADIRRGGTDIARAAENAWKLSRGQAAAF